jgi:hypothetical protein
MPNLFTRGSRPLPDTLFEDLQELLTWDNNCLLTWGHVGGEAEPDGSRWFSVLFSRSARGFNLRLEFWVPEWMAERGLEAILPAHLKVTDIVTGKRAAVDLGSRSREEWEASLPKVARTCARLLNELWGVTASDDVLLMGMEYQQELAAEPF